MVNNSYTAADGVYFHRIHFVRDHLVCGIGNSIYFIIRKANAFNNYFLLFNLFNKRNAKR